MRRVLYLLPVVAFAALAGYFALALRPDHDPQLLPSALIDKPMPTFDLAKLKGSGTLTTASLEGQVVLVNFFASWCVPCRLEHPLLMRLANSDKVAIYGIAYKDNVDESKRILQQLGDPYRAVGLDVGGRTGFDFGVYGVPETYVIDRAGHIRQRFVGPLTAETVERKLLPLLKKLAAS